MNEQRRAFLRAVEAATEPGWSSASMAATRERRLGAKTGALALGLAAAGSLFLSPAASAAPVGGDGAVGITAGCSEPDPVPTTQSKWCGFANYVFAYTGQSYHPGPALWRTCYVFDLTIFHAACGGTVHVGRKDACD